MNIEQINFDFILAAKVILVILFLVITFYLGKKQILYWDWRKKNRKLRGFLMTMSHNNPRVKNLKKEEFIAWEKLLKHCPKIDPRIRDEK